MIKKSHLHFVANLPGQLNVQDCILIFDQVLLRKHSRWIKKFPRRLGLRSGETLKDLKNFPRQMQRIIDLSAGVSRSQMTVVAFGGGSVGDFAGFVASILKRGVRLVQVPSTWLSAIDSAHGGKTALNVGRIKNQIGTFYSAQNIFLVKQVLLQQPPERTQEALGELYKMALIDGGRLWKACQKTQASRTSSTALWNILPLVIRAKMKIVAQDPYEQKSIRAILNLGHTVGHIFESELGIAHGHAVHLGILFSLNWGEQLGLWKYRDQVPAHLLPSQQELVKKLQTVTRKSKTRLTHVLSQDKKMDRDGRLLFIFVKSPGHPLVKKMKLSQLVDEWQRQQRP